MWRNRLKDHGRALLSYERVLELLPQAEPDSALFREGRRYIAQAMDAMSCDYSAVFPTQLLDHQVARVTELRQQIADLIGRGHG